MSKRKKNQATRGTYKKIFDFFNAPVMQVDCGAKCAPLNGGEPVCCSADNAIPVVQMSEWKVLRSRTDMWKNFIPVDAASRKIVEELDTTCKAIECNGARNCERDNRSLACRTFPFFPYIDKDGDIIGLSYYWDFEDRCWVISNMALVEQDFVDEFIKAYEILFENDPGEYEVFCDHSASMRRVFSRWKRPFAVIGRDGEYFKVMPKGAGMKKIKDKDLPKFDPFTTKKAFDKAVREAEEEASK
ncbi:MAG: hypothetical protein OEW37_03510 [Rhodospirillaceae bacterium]|nr:hypothetical protein [Rhodospirillaceae bacterium]